MNVFMEWAELVRRKLFTSGIYGYQVKFAKYEDASNDVTGQNVTDQAVSQSDTGKDVGQNSTDAGDSSQAAADKSVPYDRFKEVNEAKKASDEKLAQVQAENELLQQQMAVAAANPKQDSVQKNLFEQVQDQLGLGDRDWLNAKETGEVQTRVLQIVTTHAQNQAFIESHPDYASVVGSYVNGKFVAAASMLRVLSKLPNTAQIVLSSPGAGKAIYEIVKADPDYIKSQTKDEITPEQKAAADAAATLENANRQASISSVQGGGNLDKVSQIQQMSDADFDKHWEKITGGAIT